VVVPQIREPLAQAAVVPLVAALVARTLAAVVEIRALEVRVLSLFE